MSAEFELIGLAIALYLYDSTFMLYADDGLLLRTGKGWRAMLGSDEFVLFRRYVYVANPLTPYVPVVRLAWRMDSVPTEPSVADWPAAVVSLRNATPFVLLAGISLYVVLPAALLIPLGSGVVLSSALCIYGGIASALWMIYPVCRRAQWSNWRFASMAFECLACPPFGVNVIRRIAQRLGVDEDYVLAAERLQAADWTSTKATCIERSRLALEEEPLDSERALRLREAMRVRFGEGEPA